MPSRTIHALRLAFLPACLLVALPLAAQQRVSLADRVAALERQAAAPQGNVELLNQITVLQGEIQALRAQIEELQRLQQQQSDKARSQYLDLDGRLVRLEGGAPAASDRAAIDVPADSGSDDAPPPATVVEQAPPASADEQDDYLAAFEELKRGDYVASAAAFESFLIRHPGGTYAPNALYWLGESYYVTQNYELAEQQFRAVLERFPGHDKAAGALLKVGLSQFGQGATDAAAATLVEVVERYPGSDVARTAEDSLRSMRFDGL
jgi:tol-pal system protein YbgF